MVYGSILIIIIIVCNLHRGENQQRGGGGEGEKTNVRKKCGIFSQTEILPRLQAANITNW